MQGHEAPSVETRWLRVAADAEALRAFIALAERDLADPRGAASTWPELRAQVEEALGKARVALAEIEQGEGESCGK